MSPERIAQCAELSMLLELSSSPKPGNVDRCHDFEDLGFHQFLVSAVSSYPTFRKAASGEGSIGELILEAVEAWRDWGLQGNTHFGSLALLVPLAVAAGRSEAAAGAGDATERAGTIGTAETFRRELSSILRDTTVEDALNFYKAFRLAGVRVEDVEKFSLKDSGSPGDLACQGKTLLDLMLLSQGHDLIAREWSTDFERSFHLSHILMENVSRLGLNCGVVRTFLLALSEVPDSLIRAKYGLDKALQVSARAARALADDTLSLAEELDRELLLEDVNPGSTADLIAASLFIALLKGLRFR